MRNDVLNIGFVTTLSGRWPVELPGKRQDEYEAFMRDKFGQDANIVTTGRVSSNTDQLMETVQLFKSEQVDVIVMLYGAFTGDDVSTILAEQVGVPLVLWAPYEPPFDGGRLLANALVSLTMNSASLKRLGHTSHAVYGGLDDEQSVKKLTAILNGYKTVKKVRGITLGLFGYRPTAFYNSAFDEALIRKTFGIRIEETSLVMVFNKMQSYSQDAVDIAMTEAGKIFKTENLPDGHLENHARLYLALNELMEQQRYDYATIKCWPEMGQLKTTPCAVLGRLADNGKLISCEGDVDVTLAMIFQHCLTREPTFVTDMINVDKEANTLTFWHCGNPAPSLIEGDYTMGDHPLAGQGTAFNCVLKTGKVTVSRLCNIDGQYKLFVVRGEAVPTVRNTGGSMVNVRINMPVHDFVYKIIEEGIPHHYSVAYGDIADDMIFAAKLLGIETIEF